jgi:uncharacterized protein YjeT (DUF2065 family)
MDTPSFVAAILGPVYILVGLGIVIEPAQYRRVAEEFLRSPSLLYLGGATAFTIGLSILYFHREWSSDWRVLVTLVGWIASLKGALLLVILDHAERIWLPVVKRNAGMRLAGTIAIALGIFFTLAGYTDTLD